MNAQNDLFTDTRREARERTVHHQSATLAACVRVLRASKDGLTADEIAERLGVSILSVRPRITELKRGGLILDTGIRRLARGGSGTSQAVFIFHLERGDS